jgi:hypothetical protein
MGSSAHLKIKAAEDGRPALRDYIAERVRDLAFSRYGDIITFTNGDEYDVDVYIDEVRDGEDLFAKIAEEHPAWKMRLEHSSHFDEDDGWTEWQNGRESGRGESSGERVERNRAIRLDVELRVLPYHAVSPTVTLYSEPKQLEHRVAIGDFSTELILPGGRTIMTGQLVLGGRDGVELCGLQIEIASTRVPVSFWSQWEDRLRDRALLRLSPVDRARIDKMRSRKTKMKVADMCAADFCDEHAPGEAATEGAA